ncbi:hypothetical protein FA95DRAFT_1213122 [Auriscalpium vulgare]|uniref:Uncharacterized protein n=1 Tax=Auriscalpium vulgare TaxID=40419 RepID=A0ACB8RTU5_9AGAM|nr:hypothetical protein FA95DRAFT_1213122 [Auriscalpium vulgare]
MDPAQGDRPPFYMAGPARATRPDSSVRMSRSLPIQRELTPIVPVQGLVDLLGKVGRRTACRTFTSTRGAPCVGRFCLTGKGRGGCRHAYTARRARNSYTCARRASIHWAAPACPRAMEPGSAAGGSARTERRGLL